MSETLRRIVTLVLDEDFLVSDHGYDELADDDILLDDAIGGIAAAVVIEDYPDRARGPSVLVLEHDATGRPVAYRPDPRLWDNDFKRRIQK